MLHLIDVPGLDRRDVITVIDPEMPLGLLEDFRHEVAVWTAAVEIIVPGPYVVQARGYAPHRCRLAFGNRVLSERRIDADMHVSIDATRERQEILGVEHLLRLLRLDIGRKARDLSLFDRDVETIHRRLVGPRHAGVLDHKVEELFHSRVFSLPTLPPRSDELTASQLADLAGANRACHQTFRRHRCLPLFLPDGRARESYRLPSASISGVPINSLRPEKSSMWGRNGSEVPPAASEA